MTSRHAGLAIALALALLGAACGGGRARARRPGEEYLASIRLEGNHAVDADEVVPGLALHRAQVGGRGIEEYQLGLDVQRIESLYVRRGYLAVRIEPRVERKGDAATLIFAITEGPRATARVELAGLPTGITEGEARRAIGVEDGAPFSYEAYDLAKPVLVALVENAGYPYARMEASVVADRARNVATLRYAFDAGPRATFGRIEVVGATGELADAIRGRATLREGDVYSTQSVTESQQAIYGIGRFQSVRVDVDRTSQSATISVTITVALARRNELVGGIGGGLDTSNYQLRLRGSYSHKGWPTPLTTLGVEARPALTALRDRCGWDITDCEIQPRVRLIGTIDQQDVFRRGLNLQIQGGPDYLVYEPYTTVGARGSVSLTLPRLWRHFQGTLGWQFGAYRFEDINEAIDDATAARLGIDHFQRLGAFTQSIAAELRDNPIEPTKGVYAAVKLAEGTAIAGSAYDYLQVTPDLRVYAPLGRLVIAARARLGVIRGEVPPTERYYGGGASSQRGFAERRLSPVARGVDSSGDPISVVIGGAASFDTGVELRTKLEIFSGWKVGAVAFLDGGDVTDTPDELDVTNLHWAVGIGLRPFYLPVGPIRIDVAYRLNRTGPGEPSEGSHWNWHLSLGESF